MFRLAATLLIAFLFSTDAAAQNPPDAKKKKEPPPRPTPTIANYAYGPSPRHRFDLWLAPSEKPNPLVVIIHGGGWRGGDKSSYNQRDIGPFLKAGISVAAINYRFIEQAMEEKIEPPVKACLHDAGRAIQTMRAYAKEWNLDPERIGATGSSAGACTSLWLAMHDDLADASSTDPIARQSTRLTCAAVLGAQTSLDPEEVRAWMPNAVYGGHAFGFAAKDRKRPEEFAMLLAKRKDVLPWIKEYSPIELVTPDDPPIFLAYPNQKTPPQLGKEEPDPTHSALYGIKLADKLKAAGVEAVLSYPGHEDEKYKTATDFLIAKLRGP